MSSTPGGSSGGNNSSGLNTSGLSSSQGGEERIQQWAKGDRFFVRYAIVRDHVRNEQVQLRC
jgi:hypothetical protein